MNPQLNDSPPFTSQFFEMCKPCSFKPRKADQSLNSSLDYGSPLAIWSFSKRNTFETNPWQSQPTTPKSKHQQNPQVFFQSMSMFYPRGAGKPAAQEASQVKCSQSVSGSTQCAIAAPIASGTLYGARLMPSEPRPRTGTLFVNGNVDLLIRPLTPTSLT